jgi:hypothetical protein
MSPRERAQRDTLRRTPVSGREWSGRMGLTKPAVCIGCGEVNAAIVPDNLKNHMTRMLGLPVLLRALDFGEKVSLCRT